MELKKAKRLVKNIEQWNYNMETWKKEIDTLQNKLNVLNDNEIFKEERSGLSSRINALSVFILNGEIILEALEFYFEEHDNIHKTNKK